MSLVVTRLGHSVIARETNIAAVAALTEEGVFEVAIVGVGEDTKHALDLIGQGLHGEATDQTARLAIVNRSRTVILTHGVLQGSLGDHRVSERRVLVVDDEPQLRRALTNTLRGAGYAVDSACNGEEALALAASAQPDAIILDLVLPDVSGVEVCRELRRWSSVPILILSVVGDESQKVAALDAGADDYVTKPFGVAELLARLRASLRRVAPSQEPVITVGELVVDLERSSLTVAGRPVQLTRTEFALVSLLSRHAGKLFTHRAILREVWGPEYQSEAQYLHVHISHLRAKIEPDRARPRYILTEPGAGYRMAVPDAGDPGRPPVV